MKLQNRHFLSIKEVSNLIGISISTINLGVKEEPFPPKHQLSSQRIGFLKYQIDQWMDEKKMNGNWIMVEDSGLFVDVLGGFPGVYSSYVHFTVGIEGILKLLEEKNDRSARYISSIAFWDGEHIHSVQGQCVGRISIEPKGDAGFGYDPIFIPEAGDGRTFSEMDMTEKLDLSHRTMALKMMIQKLNFPSI